MLGEGLWVFLSFVLLIVLSFKRIKKSILSTLDNKIKSVESSIVDVEEAKQLLKDQLLLLKEEYSKAIAQYETIIAEAKTEAQNIINDTEEKVKMLDAKSLEIINEYKKQTDTAMIDTLKGDVLMTILNLLEAEQKQNTSDRSKNVDDTLNLIKKIWN